jgi:hypothetical protein
LTPLLKKTGAAFETQKREEKSYVSLDDRKKRYRDRKVRHRDRKVGHRDRKVRYRDRKIRNRD